ncbi:unnamed protein product [Penicillium nalgiovense]|uniref:Thioesterase domain-containing protein n=3 Tax=Penicillium TaxID=5073 RepID=A0A9W4H8N6_PENNA|nr:unnamed protein product [Penicillium nalgiovense]CAG8015559.1 unnamed protein product [Penicillium salamii]CRL24018.1 unnamed protein product [Penicillium camemberti]CAG7939518.1 unnamed protein product [Penicillium nalgiovense]CAG7940977.1 unnamed protein product [Penicillium nalgiovense]
MPGIIKRQCLLSLIHRTIRAYRSLTEQYPAPSCDYGSNLAKRPHPFSVSDSDQPQIEMMNVLFQGYCPTFKPHPLGWEAESLLLLSPAQQMCYYNGKLFGGYIALLMDRILADCCKPAVTAYLNTSYLQSVPPTTPILIRAWPERVEGRKIYLKGSLQIPGNVSPDWVDAIKTDALFIKPKDRS